MRKSVADMSVDELLAEAERFTQIDAALTKEGKLTLLQKARDMRHAIDMLEGAMMGLGDFVELPRIWAGADAEVLITPKMKVGQMRRVCRELEECTRIINSPEYVLPTKGEKP